MAPIFGKHIIPEEYINTHKVNNAPRLISQLEPSAPNKIVVKDNMWTGVSTFSGVTLAIVTPEKHIPKKKNNMKSPTISPPRKYPIPNQYINIFII